MSRRHHAEKRQIEQDSKYKSHSVAKFVNCLMRGGKKSTAERIIYSALESLTTDDRKGIDVFYEAIKNVQPTLEVRSRRVGGSTYQIPVEVRDDRRLALAIRWTIDAARARNEKSMSANLAAELNDAFQGRGAAVKKKEDTHKMAEANRAFAHYMW
ncbi:MAG: 30S ribosomal protein S7 [Candidatus Lambdaproteobacteria bacterium RIFOXYD12_FULL_49_8]|uniref:Small ribosomal subunit protein uS7 n=1 Tax=Candidatus Lambdaproteobacteria bacterium RIFOXYD2_FULL_50_16 TaxID=1817772 RepID=A0A1F6G6G8_9PROT|nr:MAG: 30S ribosomal protein S7 [Candidatus Lambdaproteobacteria bacterium RIFOXYD2_FULL_50_16]OGG96388.1 MAG: 30S ribosomal protein S7 [Candidatus Lambdaproteobacteria bacterium RIFOXYD12_FULL_49_8]